MKDLPTRVCRVGGTVETFDEPRRAYKKVVSLEGETVATLTIPSGTRVVYPAEESGSWNSSKLRVERCVVESIEGDVHRALSPVYRNTLYKEGWATEPDAFDPDTTTVSASGVHCFPDREGAENWSHRQPRQRRRATA
jgi:hypothetical protein